MKHNRDPESKPKLQAAQGKLMWEPPECPGPCFDLYFDRFDGFIFEAEKPFENVCAKGASPVQLREYLFLHLFSVSKKRNGDHFFGVENSKKE